MLKYLDKHRYGVDKSNCVCCRFKSECYVCCKFKRSCSPLFPVVKCIIDVNVKVALCRSFVVKSLIETFLQSNLYFFLSSTASTPTLQQNLSLVRLLPTGTQEFFNIYHEKVTTLYLKNRIHASALTLFLTCK